MRTYNYLHFTQRGAEAQGCLCRSGPRGPLQNRELVPSNSCPVLLPLCSPLEWKSPSAPGKQNVIKKEEKRFGKSRKHLSPKWVWNGLLFFKWNQIPFVPFPASLLYQECQEARDDFNGVVQGMVQMGAWMKQKLSKDFTQTSFSWHLFKIEP